MANHTVAAVIARTLARLIGEISTAELRPMLSQLPRATMVAAVRRLVDQGYVRRHAGIPQSKNKPQKISLTEAGLAWVKAGCPKPARPKPPPAQNSLRGVIWRSIRVHAGRNANFSVADLMADALTETGRSQRDRVSAWINQLQAWGYLSQVRSIQPGSNRYRLAIDPGPTPPVGPAPGRAP